MKSSVLIFALTASLQGFYFKKIKLLDTEYSMDIPGDWEVCEQNKESIKYCKDNFFPNLIIIKNYTQRAQELYNLGVNSQKLNKQVSILESNPNFILSYHNISTNTFKVSAMQNSSDFDFGLKSTLIMKKDSSLSIVYRNILNSVKMPSFLISVLSGDWAFEVILLTKGKGHYMSDVMGYYRSHVGGVSTAHSFQSRKRKSKWIFISKMLFWSPKHAPLFLNFLIRNISWRFPKIKYLIPSYLFKKIRTRLSSVTF